MAHRTGLSFKTVDKDSPVPSTVKEIAGAYKQASTNLLEAIKSNWTDETLNEEDDMYGERWKRGTTLGVISGHQIHYRAQLIVVMRLLGLEFPVFMVLQKKIGLTLESRQKNNSQKFNLLNNLFLANYFF
jgi:uncharacterized damage-inducible protein DinB